MQSNAKRGPGKTAFTKEWGKKARKIETKHLRGTIRAAELKDQEQES